MALLGLQAVQAPQDLSELGLQALPEIEDLLDVQDPLGRQEQVVQVRPVR
jgi:hypothetical protein